MQICQLASGYYVSMKFAGRKQRRFFHMHETNRLNALEGLPLATKLLSSMCARKLPKA